MKKEQVCYASWTIGIDCPYQKKIKETTERKKKHFRKKRKTKTKELKEECYCSDQAGSYLRWRITGEWIKGAHIWQTGEKKGETSDGGGGGVVSELVNPSAARGFFTFRR